MTVRVEHGDCLVVMGRLADEGLQVESVVTDPPYHLTSIVKRFGKDDSAPAKSNGATGVYGRAAAGFMGQKWDGGDIAFRPETWQLVGALLKPGGHMVVFGGTRTYHRVAGAIEDAGFEIRDAILWHYGSGFPKSHNVSKGIDKFRRRDFVKAAIRLGLELPGRSIDDWTKENHAPGDKWWEVFKSSLPAKDWQRIEREIVGTGKSGETAWFVRGDHEITAPATDAAKQWDGWGTALKPATEIICLARKPLSEKTVAANVLRWGTGALNIDGCRVESSGEHKRSYQPTNNDRVVYGVQTGFQPTNAPGRWPANVIHDGSEEVMEAFARFGERPSTRASGNPNNPKNSGGGGKSIFSNAAGLEGVDYRDTGTAARFFYCAKADKGDRLQSKHPTVKPVDLVSYLCRLITRPGGTVLDPFAGSGTTAMACLREGFDAILIEKEARFVADIKRRLAHVEGADTPLFQGAPA